MWLDWAEPYLRLKKHSEALHNALLQGEDEEAVTQARGVAEAAADLGVAVRLEVTKKKGPAGP